MNQKVYDWRASIVCAVAVRWQYRSSRVFITTLALTLYGHAIKLLIARSGVDVSKENV